MNDVIEILEEGVTKRDFSKIQKILDNPNRENERKFIFNYLSNEMYDENDFVLNLRGYMFDCGSGTQKNMEKAFELYTKSSKMGYSCAFHNLGHLYMYGCRSKYEGSNTTATEYYIKSAQLGNNVALNRLSEINGSENQYCTIENIDVAISMYAKTRHITTLLYIKQTQSNIESILLDLPQEYKLIKDICKLIVDYLFYME